MMAIFEAGLRLMASAERLKSWTGDPQGDVKVATVYDGLGRSVQTSNPFRPSIPETAQYTTTAYDRAGRVISLTSPDLAVVATAYSGNRVLVTDQAGEQRLSQTDGLGRLTDVWEVTAADSATESIPAFPNHPEIAAGYRTKYSYDVLDNLIETKQQIGTTGTTQTRTFVYDGLKRLTRAINPESGTVDYTYDENSNLKTKFDARSITTTYDYDALNRVKSRTYTNDPQNTPAVAYKYDGQALTPGYPSSFNRGYSTGRLVATTYGGGTAGNYIGYDQLGRPNTSYQQTDSQNYGFGYAYSIGGEMTSETYPSGRVVMTDYDAAGRVAGVKNQATGLYYAGAAATDATNRIQYASHGAIGKMKLGNGKWEHTNFNNRLQPTQIGLGVSGTDSSLLKLDYTYNNSNPAIHDNNGNVSTQTITIGSTVMTQSYGYDALNRLSSASETGAASWLQNYGYDRFGNRWYSGGSYLPNPTLTPQSSNAVNAGTNKLTASLYDNAGNQYQDAAQSGFTYDAENRQVSSSVGGSSATYGYDGDGRRVKKVLGTNTTLFVYNVGGQLIAEYTSDTPIGSGTSYLTSDHLGSTRVVTDTSANVKSRHDFLPFGEEIGTDHRPTGLNYGAAEGVRQKFTQKERDNESGLDYFLARYYSSAQGRFTSVDPAGGSASDAQSWNGYSYSRNNPLKYVDPDGLKYKLIDLNGNSIDDYSDDEFNKNFRGNKKITLKSGNIYQNGDLIGRYERLSFDDLGPFAQGVYNQLSARRNASYQAIGAFAGGTAVGGGIAGGAAFLGGVALGGSSITTLGLEGAAEAANAAEAASLIAQAASTVGNQGARAGSRAVAEQAARDWVGQGAREIVDRQTGQIVGRISADGTRIARFTSANKAQPYINLVNKVTGGNLHIRF